MLIATDLVKKFGDFTAVSGMNFSVDGGCVLGLIGSNGAGKSTIIRMLTGVYKPTSGTVSYDGEDVFDNVAVKRNIFYFPDELYFAGTTVKDIAKFYAHFFPMFNTELYFELCDSFKLKKTQPIMACSKGMKRQVMMNAAIASNAKYIFLDEAFDGLDAVARQTYIRLFIEIAREKDTCVIVATHNIREIDHFCDRLCLLYKSNMIADTTPDELVHGRTRVILGENCGIDPKSLIEKHNVSHKIRGSEYTLTFNSNRANTVELLKNEGVKEYDVIPMTLEDSFVSELEESGYAIKDIDIV